ncbi:hypothetical protein ACVWXO_004575 [Bradyrhizobium sp. LM2.7]
MNSRSKSARNKSARTKPALGKPTTKNSAGKSPPKANSSRPASKTAKLPEWNLADLYSGIDAPEVARDLERMDADCVAFETDYRGKLATGTANEDGGKMARAGRAAL